MYGICRTAVLLGLLAVAVLPVRAQSASTAQSGNSPSTSGATPEKQIASPTANDRTGPIAEDKNRREFEKNAGEQAGKLLLRSLPGDAEVFINGLFVGRTPLLMVVAPGKYDVVMRGERQESEQSTVGVMPKETQTVLLKLTQRYPASLGVRWPGQ